MGVKRTGIMGGTFNPVHTAHLIVAEAAYEHFGFDTVMFLPSGQPAYKQISELLPDSQRRELVQLAIAGNPHFSFSDLELCRAGNTYTADTALELKSAEKDTEFYFIIGGDSLMNFERWNRPEVILRHAHLAVTGRAGIGQEEAVFLNKAEELRKKYSADIRFFPTPAMEISSTDIRERIRNGRSIRYLVPDAVEQYLMEHGCFQTIY
ncbi:MAG: nicotinate-nucleotide adenylyltransferase [Lachnospiraceae bacterium]|nr:nicotinate-nucleotide adenylyltransferase [Lachnospiraceae bacterium]